ncbi:unnamed protein product [marine sediment metagenome]|uniref:Uncharacterized protein n=1 Tax=marine sediment metagenome TaxID=412755 RepID=X1QA92_9ZZZZ
MVMEKLAEAAKEAERRFGLPPLSKFAETIENLPDERRLRLIKEMLVVAERVSHTAPELDKVVNLIHELNSVPIEKLEKLEKLLRRIEKLIKTAPEELLNFVTSLKEE